jgi:uncharacterized membrane protein
MSHESPPGGGERETGRVEAFSDGVFAIAITLLALELKVPHETTGVGIGKALLAQWPTYLAFLTSFATIGIMWLNHHRLFTLIRRVDNGLMAFNLLLLLGITTVCFPTNLISMYLGHEGEREAALLYSGTYLVIAISFNLLWRYASSPSRSPRLLGVPDDHPLVVEIQRRYGFGPISYAVSLVVAFWSPRLSFALVLGLALYWAVQLRWSVARRHRPGS